MLSFSCFPAVCSGVSCYQLSCAFLMRVCVDNESMHTFVKCVYSCTCVWPLISLVPFVTIWSVAFLFWGAHCTLCRPRGPINCLAACCAPWLKKEKMAWKVQIKLLWTNFDFDQGTQWWKAFSPKSQKKLSCAAFLFHLLHIVVSSVFFLPLCNGECQAFLSWLHTNAHMNIELLKRMTEHVRILLNEKL